MYVICIIVTKEAKGMEHILPHFLKLVRSKLILKDYMSEIHQILLLGYVLSPDEKLFFIFESI